MFQLFVSEFDGYKVIHYSIMPLFNIFMREWQSYKKSQYVKCGKI